MKFKIIAQCFQQMAPNKDNGKYDFYLEQDKWDDFGYHTSYHIHAGKKLTEKNPEYLGLLNIMRSGQKVNDYYLISKEVGEMFETLPDDFCSISMSVELYRGLDRLLPQAEDRKTFANALKMIFSSDDEGYKRFKDEDCFTTSLMRNASMEAYGLSLGKEIMLDETSSYDLAQIPLTYTLPDGGGEIDFDFSTIGSGIESSIDVPSRLLVCIGNNGAGKSTILYRLARILFASPASRGAYEKDLGTIDPSDAGFRRLFLISYSAFDNFTLPGVDVNDYKLILDGLKNREGRLVYCGIRDVVQEYEQKINEDGNNQPISLDENAWARWTDKDHDKVHKLKTVDNLAEEAIQAYLNISHDNEKLELWNRLMTECEKANTSFADMQLSPHAYLFGGMITGEKLKQLSTGIKYLLHSLSQIIDRIEQNSIIIFDEPENHIQPPLLCKFLYCLRIISQTYRSLVLVATHSPVIVQETLARNVIIVNREGKDWKFRHPSIETYGENIGNITDEVFNLNTSVTNYQKTASMLFDHYINKGIRFSDPMHFLNYIREESGLDLGNEIKAYLISRFIEREN